AWLAFGDAQEHPSPARAVELAEEDRLPCAEERRTVPDQHRDRGSDQRGLDVAVGVVLDMRIVRVLRRELREPCEYVPKESWIGALVDRDAGGRVRHEDVTHAVLHAAVGDGLRDMLVELDELGTLARVQRDL